ncbi:MAG: 50S ribosomal protein L3, partial [bacterium]|nr:50S ribosomal protein L3 [bacterium]
FSEEGLAVPVTVVKAGPCVVIQKKTAKSDGYDAIQIGFKTARKKTVTKPLQGHFEKKKVGLYKHLKEFRISPEAFEVGQSLTVAGFQPGDRIDVLGITQGRGFLGVMKRHGKHGGPDGHGSGFHRRPGSIGMRTWPGRVMKNMKLPGRMGTDQVLIRNLKVVDVKPEENLILLSGSIPGARNGLVIIFNREEGFDARFSKTEDQKPESGGQV